MLRRKVISILAVLLVLSISSSVAFAGSIHLSGTSFSLGSLIEGGTLSGLGNTDVTVVLDASGIPYVICTNQGGNQAPGQNPAKVNTRGSVPLLHTIYKNGSSPFSVETLPPDISNLTAVQLGCANNNWTASLPGWISWTNATLSVYDAITGVLLFQQNYICTTTQTGIGSTDGKVSCTATK